MHGIDIADIRVARVGALDTRRVSDHFSDASSCLLRRGSKLDMIVQALAHLGFAVDAQHLFDLPCA